MIEELTIDMMIHDMRDVGTVRCCTLDDRHDTGDGGNVCTCICRAAPLSCMDSYVQDSPEAEHGNTIDRAVRTCRVDYRAKVFCFVVCYTAEWARRDLPSVQ